MTSALRAWRAGGRRWMRCCAGLLPQLWPGFALAVGVGTFLLICRGNRDPEHLGQGDQLPVRAFADRA